MKPLKIIALIALVLISAATLSADKPEAEIKFKTTKIDLGNIPADGGPVKFKYEFTNVGTKPLIVVTVTNGGCGCTRPDYPKAPIKPGDSGVVNISFDPTGRRGEFRREIKLRCNGKKKDHKLKFYGVVVPGNND